MTLTLPRVRGPVAALFVWLAVSGAVSAAPAVGRDRPPSARELWQQYPLGATPQPTSTATATATSPAATATPAPAQGVRRSDAATGGGGAIWIVLGVVVAVAALAAWALLRFRDRLPAVPRLGAAPALGAAAVGRRAQALLARGGDEDRAAEGGARPAGGAGKPRGRRDESRAASAPASPAQAEEENGSRESRRPNEDPGASRQARRSKEEAGASRQARRSKEEAGAARKPRRPEDDAGAGRKPRRRAKAAASAPPEPRRPVEPVSAERPPRSASGGASEPPAPGPVPPAPALAWTAGIDWHHSGGQSRFCVVATAADGTTATLAESSALEWPPTGPAGVQAMTDAAQALEISMLAAGWRPLPSGDGWYAKRFAWPPAPAPAPRTQQPPGGPAPAPRAERSGRFVRSTEWPDGTKELWRCEIKWDAGYLSSRFRAMLYRPGRSRGRSIGESHAFRWTLMEDPDPNAPEHRAAVRDLAAALEAAGWERVPRGSHWYVQRFVWRRRGEPPERVEPAPGEAGRTR